MPVRTLYEAPKISYVSRIKYLDKSSFLRESGGKVPAKSRTLRLQCAFFNPGGICFEKGCKAHSPTLYLFIWRVNEYNYLAMENITCDNDETVYMLSNICFKGVNTSFYECVKTYNFTITLVRKATGLWMLLIGIVGVIGNVATLTTVPCAIRRRRHQLHKNVKTSTVFILNL